MKRYPAFFGIALVAAAGLICVFPLGCASVHGSTTLAKIPLEKIQSQIQRQKPAKITAGAAKVEITPAVGTPLAGYSKRKGKPSTGIRDSLYVRTLVLSDGTDTAVFVSADLLIFPPPLAEQLFKQIAKEFKLYRQSVVLCATHTHSGMGAIAPGFLYEMVFGEYDPEVIEGLKARIIWSIRQALERMEPVQWGVESAPVLGLTENRRNPLGPTDPKITVFMVESVEKKKPLAILVNAAAHPTLLGSQDMRFSGDFPGEVSRLLETAYPDSVCLFVNGAAGDLRPSGQLASDPEEKIRNFSQGIAEQAGAIVSRLKLSPKGDVVTWGWRMNLPSPQVRLGPVPVPSLIGRMMRPTSAYLNLIALDRLIFVPLSAELTTGLGQGLRHRLVSQGVEPLLLGYANGYLGYAVTPQEFRDGSYESWMTWYGPSFGELMVDGIEALAGVYSEESKEGKDR
ncbi:MAG: neutral/alkaline non-lysosomal ceramidase N-terminal domain-containing protein [Candidatus Omnitrophica bacterium]|nr:neutral/alkaline non-lysosomal ceramidase N-terminal domain-containing protein [Candidatus Omnitrophota bacterium]